MGFRQSAANILPLKFILLLVQTCLLVLVLIGKDLHLWWPIGQVDFAPSSKEYITADKTLVGVSSSWIAICAFEFLMMIFGSSVPEFLVELNFLQVVLHFMGTLFTTWFLLDAWRYTLIWVLWAVFAVPAFLIELVTIQQSIKLNADIKKNANG